MAFLKLPAWRRGRIPDAEASGSAPVPPPQSQTTLQALPPSTSPDPEPSSTRTSGTFVASPSPLSEKQEPPPEDETAAPAASNAQDVPPPPKADAVPLDIEHVHVENDPRGWSPGMKQLILAIIATASIAPTLGASIYNPAFTEIQAELGATNAEIALSLSLFILVQGNAPLVWSAISEIKGRKLVYLVSMTLFAVGCAIAATAHSIGLLIGMRVVQAAGASAVLSVGAGTLADIFEPRERGAKLGIYYAAPLLGPSLGPLIGGALTQRFDWRATFWCLLIFAGFSLSTFVFLKDTFRRERSLAYQSAVHRALSRAKMRGAIDSDPHAEGSEKPKVEGGKIVSAHTGAAEEIKLSLADVNPVTPTWRILRRANNLSILVASGLLFAYAYSMTYTAARTFAEAPYNYNSLDVGLVLLSFGLGNVGGSILGGRWSDHSLARAKAANGGVSYPEMRLKSTHFIMPILPLSTIAYAWMANQKVQVAGPVVALFFAGFSVMWIYSSTLAYIVDANTGRSSTAVATNSSFRGLAGFVASEVAVPLQLAIGDGGLYTIWAALTVVSISLILLTELRGSAWREASVAREARKEAEKAARDKADAA